MNKFELIKAAKDAFYAVLDKHSISPEMFLVSPGGRKLIDAAMSGSTEMQKQASVLSDILLQLIGSPSLAGIAGLGTAGGVAAGAALGRLTSPAHAQISNLQKKELIAEYDSAIQSLRNRIEAKRLGSTVPA